jgi:putative holliday junction resolvase
MRISPLHNHIFNICCPKAFLPEKRLGDIMKRLVCFDYGTHRIGIAVSDPLQVTAQPLGTVKVTTQNTLNDELKQLLVDIDIEKAVVGLPLNMNGTEGDIAGEARIFADLVRDEYNVPVVLWDERLSSRSAERVLLEHNMRRRKRKLKKDVIAAVIILQNYLDFLAG